jgi:putative DNA methylase
MLVNYKKKLIEVALPLEAINKVSAPEKSIRHGHPSTLHLWWARRPLAAARAVIFAQMVADPSGASGYFQDREGAGERAPAAFQDHRRPGSVGEHDKRSGTPRCAE